jgi:hypothetical protein
MGGSMKILKFPKLNDAIKKVQETKHFSSKPKFNNSIKNMVSNIRKRA